MLIEEAMASHKGNKLAEKFNIEVNKTKFKALLGTGTINNEKVVLIKPQTFMNLSGEAVQEFANFYKVEPQNIIVIFDCIVITLNVICFKELEIGLYSAISIYLMGKGVMYVQDLQWIFKYAKKFLML